MVTLVPTHMHLHHLDSSTSQAHEHRIDFHFTTDNFASEHHENATIFPTTPDVLIKKLSDQPLIAVFLIILAGFLLPAANSILLRRFNHNNQIPVSFYNVTPPLRAPPL